MKNCYDCNHCEVCRWIDEFKDKGVCDFYEQGQKGRNNMADIELVIKIPEEMYQNVLNGTYCGTLYEELKNGKQLPKGHGRLIDADRLKSMYSINQANFNTVVGIQKWIERAPTILKADKENEQ